MKFINTIKQALEIRKATRRVLKDESIAEQVTEFKTNFLYAPDHVKMHGCGIALVKKDWVGNPVILVDDTFMLMSQNARQFFIGHEKAHIFIGHLDDNEEKFGTGMFSNMKYVSHRKKEEKKYGASMQEVEADVACASAMGVDNAIKALEEAIECTGESKELRARIQHLNEYKVNPSAWNIESVGMTLVCKKVG